MKQLLSQNKKHTKLLLFLGVIILLISSYFIYKYTYIYTERRKYDQAEISIKKVADDLRKQGIETEFSKNCSRDQAKNDTGALHCSVGIFYENVNDELEIKSDLNNFILVINAQGYNLISGSINIAESPLQDSISQYASLKTNDACLLIKSTDEINTTKKINKIAFYCGNYSKFTLF